MRWAEPGWFWLLLIVLPAWRLGRRRATFTWPSVDRYFANRPRGLATVDSVVGVVNLLGLCLLVAALARPQTVGGTVRVRTRGTAIVVAFDRSSSMNAADLVEGGSKDAAVTRFESAKRVVSGFVAGRPNDLIGLVAFAGEPDLTCAPTLDHRFVLDAVRGLRTAKAGDDGTNLGDAIVWACEALKSSEAASRRLILLSDGKHAPQIRRDHVPVDPLEAAALARDLGIVVDAVAIGSTGGMIRARDPDLKVDIVNETEGPDVELLAAIAKAGGGLSFHATDPDALRTAFARIDAAAKSDFEETILTRYDERFAPFAAAGLAGWLMVVIWRTTRGRRLP